MKFSILVAHYNNAEYFKDCYKSILAQTYDNWEVVILDDASKNQEKEAVKDLIRDDKRFIFHENEINAGVGYTKSKLIELANGDICGFVDPDDALLPNALEESIKQYTSKNIIATYSKFYNCDQTLKPLNFFAHTRKIKNHNPLFFNVRFEVAHLFTFRKSAYQETSKIDPNISSSVDQDLYLKLYEKGNFAYINKPLYLYRLHEKGVSQEKSKKEKLYKNWHIVLYNTLKRRNINTLYNKPIDEIPSLPEFIFEKQNTLMDKIKRKVTQFLD